MVIIQFKKDGNVLCRLILTRNSPPLEVGIGFIARRLRAEIRQFHSKLGITTVYVTHCFEEALALADRVAVLNNGRIVQIDSSKNILKKIDCGMVTERADCECHKESQLAGCGC